MSHQSCPGFNIDFKLIWFGEFKTPTWWVFVWWWDDETDFDESDKDEGHAKRNSSKIPGKGDFKLFKLQNKQSPLSVHKLQWHQTHNWFLDLLFWLRDSCFFKRNSQPSEKPLFQTNPQKKNGLFTSVGQINSLK